MIKIKRLLSPTDFSDASKHALLYAIDFATTYGAELHLLHVIEPVMYPAEMFGQMGLVDVESVVEKAAGEELSQWSESLVPKAVKCVPSLAHGKPFTEILNYATGNDIDLIIIATHGHGALDHLLLGSNTEKIVRKAPCPVLTVRAKVREMVH